MLVTTT